MGDVKNPFESSPSKETCHLAPVRGSTRSCGDHDCCQGNSCCPIQKFSSPVRETSKLCVISVSSREQWGRRVESFRDRNLHGGDTYRRGKNRWDKMPKETRGVWVRARRILVRERPAQSK